MKYADICINTFSFYWLYWDSNPPSHPILWTYIYYINYKNLLERHQVRNVLNAKCAQATWIIIIAVKKDAYLRIVSKITGKIMLENLRLFTSTIQAQTKSSSTPPFPAFNRTGERQTERQTQRGRVTRKPFVGKKNFLSKNLSIKQV